MHFKFCNFNFLIPIGNKLKFSSSPSAIPDIVEQLLTPFDQQSAIGGSTIGPVDEAEGRPPLTSWAYRGGIAPGYHHDAQVPLRVPKSLQQLRFGNKRNVEVRITIGDKRGGDRCVLNVPNDTHFSEVCVRLWRLLRRNIHRQRQLLKHALNAGVNVPLPLLLSL